MMRTEIQEKFRLKPEDLIEHLREGKEDARDILIKTYWEFIVSSAARMTGRRSDSSDEFSIALSAFNEAIDCYDSTKNSGFLSFAGLVINRRLIGFFRKNRRYRSEYAFSSLSLEDGGESGDLTDTSIPLSEAYEIQEEVLLFKNSLMDYGITLDMLLHCAPKHEDTRAICAMIAQKLHEDMDLSRVLTKEKRLPISKLLESFSLSRKTLENNRKYIIALFLILRSDLDILKGYIESYGSKRQRQKQAGPHSKGGQEL